MITDDVAIAGRFRCVEDAPEGAGRCPGGLRPEGDGLACEHCGATYPIARGVPVLKPAAWRSEGDDGWFEAMYAGRSRVEELETDYLEGERRLLAGLARERGLRGPCLEVGCGTGLFAEAVPGYVGLEYALESLHAEGFEGFRRVCGDARRLPFADASVECAFSFNTLEHVPEVDRAFAELDRVLRPGGLLVLKPAWHCARYVTELIHVRPHAELTPRQRAVRALLPVIRSRPYKLLTRLPWRLWRRATAGPAGPLRYTPLEPYHGAEWVADADAVAGIDCHEGILYFTRRGYACVSHPTARRQLLAGHDVVVLEKGAGRAIDAGAGVD